MAACPAISALPSRIWRRPIVVSQRRIDANRRNAARSTGPRTEAGKARVARNAVTHGFFAGAARWTPEQHRDFIETYDGLRDDFRPRGLGEESCVWTLAHEFVQMAAVLRYENIAAYEHHQQEDRDLEARIAAATPSKAAKLRAHRERMRRAGLWAPTIPGPRAANGIIRCIGSINRGIRRAMRDLDGFQRFRDGGRHPKSPKLRKQTHLVQQNRTFSLMALATKAQRDLLKASRTATSSSQRPTAVRPPMDVAAHDLKTAKTNPLSSMFMGNRHERRRLAALARRRN